MTMMHQHKADQLIQYRVLLACMKESLFPSTAYIETTKGEVMIQYQEHLLHVNYLTKSAFFQMTMEGPISYSIGKEKKEVVCLRELIEILKANFGIDFHERLIDELEHSVLGLSLSLRQYEHRETAMRHALKFSRMPSELNFIAWLAHMNEDSDFSALGYTEGMIWHGHPSHPLTKTKLPLTSGDIQAYAPEFMRIVPLKIVLLHKNIVQETAMNDDANFVLNTVIPDMKRQLQQYLAPYDVALEDYRVLFIHPWQYEHVIVTQFSEYIRTHQLIPTPLTVDAKPTLSFRTMYLLGRPFHIKLPVNVQATSAVRTVSTVTTVDGPRLSHQLQAMLTQYPTLQVAMEPYGVHIDAPADIARQCAMIVRESPENTHRDIIQMVTACLIERNPVDNQVAVDSLIEYLYGKINETTISNFIRTYSQALIIPLIAYIQQYGIALEAHQQNTILEVDKNNQTLSFIVRDLGGARLDLSTLQRAIPGVEVTNTSLIAENIDAVIAKFQHAVIQNQLGTLIHHFKHKYQCDEQALYEIIRDVLYEAIDDTQPHAMALKRILFGEEVVVKALLNMRMKQQVKKYTTIALENPLHEKRVF
ncbi:MULTISPECIES: IucA/IucC family protein [unclassified Staphylococcus]|uniref:IucA/IucC family protein n=1 Tax=unclassified Staphylococcus TaxID=91994 RepID=UPI0021D17946|nr:MULTISPECIES: IucA/IucC family protein [unclassified Staphylococcus]UXR77927.1 siderophore synthetase [Staphylococcus sp. IVB6227]UXR82088.1 siderophore synthetase [Staphylococcus sp. IVB6214]